MSQNHSAPHRPLFVRILAIVLAVLLASSAITLILSIILGWLR